MLGQMHTENIPDEEIKGVNTGGHIPIFQEKADDYQTP